MHAYLNRCVCGRVGHVPDLEDRLGRLQVKCALFLVAGHPYGHVLGEPDRAVAELLQSPVRPALSDLGAQQLLAVLGDSPRIVRVRDLGRLVVREQHPPPYQHVGVGLQPEDLGDIGRRLDPADLAVLRSRLPVERLNLDLPGACSPPATGWITTGDALLANTAAALAREYDEAGRDALRQQAWADAHNTHPVAA